MPGPKMGPRPHDFDEHVIRMSPTFLKWMQLQPGQKLRYACREFVKDKGDDEERLMRRIMIARRNNIRDHETLKKARKITSKTGNTLAEEDAGDERVAVSTPQQTTLPQPDEPTVTRTAPTETMNHQLGATELVTTPPDLIGATTVTTTTPAALGSDDDNYTTTTTNSVTVAATTTTTTTTTGAAAPATSSSISTAASTSRRRRSAPVFSDQQVEQEMDVPAVEATRSYRAWADLPEGHEFVYNQKYIKGREGHDWLLRKNIWRRMRYRRENKKMVERLKKVPRLAGAGGHVHDHMTSGDESGSEQAPPLAFSPEDYRKEQLPLEQSERNAKKNHGTAGGGAGAAGSDVTVGTNEDGTLGDATAARDPSHVPSVNVTVGAAMKIEAPSAIMKMEPEEDTVMAAPSHEIDHDETTNHHLVAAAAAAASSSSGDDHHLAADPDAVAAAVAAAATFGTNESAGDGCAGETDMIASTAAVSTTSSSSSSLLLSSTATGAILPHHSLLAPPPEHDEAHAAALDAAAQLAAATTVHRAKKDQNHGGDGNGDDNNDDDDVNVALHVAADVAMAAVGDHTDLYHSMNEAAVAAAAAAAAAAAVVASASELEEV